jgi:uncharacterized protein YndB with AHSA1/START domain
MSREQGVIEREIFIAAPAEMVFNFLTNAQLMAQWLGSLQQLDPKPGGIFQVEVSPGNVARGEYTEIVPFRRVAFTWGWNSLRPDLAALRPGTSLVEIELEPKNGGTRLRLRHSHLPAGLRPIHDERWSIHLGRLADFLKDQAGEPTSAHTPIGDEGGGEDIRR